MTTTRTPEEAFAHHGQALGAEDLEEIVADYTEDAILVAQKKVYRGKDGARQVSPSGSATFPRRPGNWTPSSPTTSCTWSGRRPEPAARSRTASTRSSSRTA
jgi:hypothetical protein